MNYLHIPKAKPIHAGDEVQSVTIILDDETPEFKELHEQDAYYFVRAAELGDALYNALPGGLYDRLLGEMLARKATHFRVSHNA